MFGIGGFELFIILIFGFLIFGPDKLPEIAKTVGKGIARFREAQQEMNDTLGGEKIFDPNNPDEPFKDPVEVLDRIAQKQENTKAGTASAGTAAAPAQAAPAASAASGQAAESTQESFTERKARYERERAARKAAEAEAAAAAAAGDDSATAPAAAPAERGDASCLSVLRACP
ncbi:MAG: twin-arginine translocase TatA/TatE family subunit [Eggerthellaceae bacterium]|nr:twin-arginine translocase TatA/TatE family subunit [Eggerthellaceae bacterium]